MPLPKISTPTYELELPSTGQSIYFRPFLVKEEKVLVLQQSKRELFRDLMAEDDDEYFSGKLNMDDFQHLLS